MVRDSYIYVINNDIDKVMTPTALPACMHSPWLTCGVTSIKINLDCSYTERGRACDVM